MRSFHQDLERCLSAALMVAALAAAAQLAGCVDQGEPLDPEEHYQFDKDGGTDEAKVERPISFGDQNYDFTGPMPIADLAALIPTGEQVWYGFSPEDPYAMGDERVLDGTCGSYNNPLDSIEELPEYIEGVATLHPRFYVSASVCGQDERFYGAFFLQDSSGGILVLKDTRIADFTFGERVRLRVRGLIKFYDTRAVLAFDEQEIVEPGTVHDIYYENEDCPLDNDDIGLVRRITGTVVSEPTNDNFNELIIEGDPVPASRCGGSDGQTITPTWYVSVDRELGQRGVEFPQGERVQLTGPVVLSYGNHQLLVASVGQIERL